MTKVILLVFLVACGCAQQIKSEPLRFDNHRVYSVHIDTDEQLQTLKSFDYNINPENGFFFEQQPMVGAVANIIVPPQHQIKFDGLVVSLELVPELKIENFQELLDAETPAIQPRDGFGWESYHTLDEIYAWIDELVLQYSTILSTEVIGYSFEGLPIRVVKLIHQPGNPTILIESNIHAREWISSASATYVLNELLTSTDPSVQEIATNINWYFIPVLNPDGFTYTKTVNRLWRKSRYPHFTICYGVDLNRNFDFQWMYVGASDNPCDETYAGPTPFSDPESRVLADFVLAHREEIKVFLAFHSYGQYILLPYAYTATHVENYFELMTIGNATRDTIRERYGTQYTVGSSAEVLYRNSGSSRDWMKGAQNLNVSYTIELRDTGAFGFVLPAVQILPNCLELFDGLKTLISQCRSFDYL